MTEVAPPLTRHLGLVEYEPTWRAMQAFTNHREPTTLDEIWMVEHPPIFTLGMNGRREHLLAPGDIPVLQIDRGGQVTYHGPGQLVIYPLIDVKRANLSVRQLVVALENAVVAYAAELRVDASGSRDAPGVYVDGRKLASIGLRIRRGASYHGMSLNVSLDLEPFGRIQVCGHAGLQVTRLTDLVASDGGDAAHAAGEGLTVTRVAEQLTPHLLRELGFGALGGADPAAAANPAAAAANDQMAINTALQAVSSR